MLDVSVRDFLAQVAAPAPSATGGGVGAVTVASAAGLVTMTAALSPGVGDADEISAKAERLRSLAMQLAEQDEHVYSAVLEAQRRPSEDSERSRALRDALREAARPPLRIARAGADVAALAADLAERTKRSLRADAVTACALAAASARSSAALAQSNLSAAARISTNGSSTSRLESTDSGGTGVESLAPSVEEEAEAVVLAAQAAQRAADAALAGGSA